MLKIPQFIGTHWQDIKGNAKWDFIKWAALILIAIPPVITGFIGHAPLWEILIVLLVSTACVPISICALVWLIQKGRRTTAYSPFQPDDQTRKRFTAMVDKIKSQKPVLTGSMPLDYCRKLQPVHTIGALVELSTDIQTEDELRWHCEEFVKHGYRNTFEGFEPMANIAMQSQWLSVLRESRHSQGEVATEGQLLDFLLFKWSGKTKWKAAMEQRNSSPIAIMPEFIGGQSGEILHTCSRCGYRFKVVNPMYIAVAGGGKPVVTCPKSDCKQIDIITPKTL